MLARQLTNRPGPAAILAVTAVAAAALAAVPATPAAAAELPPPPAQGVKLQHDPPWYGSATIVNDEPSQPLSHWYAGGSGSDHSVPSMVNYVVRTADGRYTVWVPAIDPAGVAVFDGPGGPGPGGYLATAPGAYCVVAGIAGHTWNGLPGTHIEVICYDGEPDGTAEADAPFVLSYTYLDRPGPGLAGAYLRAAKPTTPFHTPDLANQFNASGTPNTVRRTGAGEYLVQLPGLDPRAGRTLVTAYHAGGHRCGLRDRTAEAIRVGCLDTGGRAADTPFGLVQAPDGGRP